MTFQERLLYQQIHPVKLSADVFGVIAGLYLLWNHDWLLGMMSIIAIPFLVGSTFIRTTDLERIKQSSLGAYMKKYITPTVEIARSAGLGVMTLGAWLHMPIVIGAGLLIALGAWLSGVFFPGGES